MSKISLDKKSVVIVGGGHAGTALAKKLSSSLDPSRYNLTLINARPFFILYPATARLVVSAHHDLDGRVFMPYDQLFEKNGSFKLGTVTAIEKHTRGGDVILETGERVKFDVVVLATGSKWDGALSFPNTSVEAKDWIERTRARISAAKDIVLVGGGAVGIELAGEIKDVYPNTEVTIVHGGSKLLNNTYPDKFRNALERSIRARGVDIILNDYVDNIPDSGVSRVTTRSGKTIAADLVLSNRGPRPNTDFVSSLGEDTLTKSGHVKVRRTLQLLSHSDVFAVGDVTDIEEQKQAGKVYAHADVVAANVLSVLEGKEAKSVYKGSIEMIVVTNGKNGGVAYFDVLWKIVLGDWFSRTLKSTTLMVPIARSQMGLKN